MRSSRWRSVQSGHDGSPELVKHTLLVEVDGISRNNIYTTAAATKQTLSRVYLTAVSSHFARGDRHDWK